MYGQDRFKEIVDCLKEIPHNQEILKLVSMAFLGSEIDEADASYIYTETDDSMDISFLGAQRLYQDKKSGRYIIPNTPASSGFSGVEKWFASLSNLIPKDVIERMPMPLVGNLAHGCLNTYSESEELIKYAHEKGYSSLHIIAPDFHILRCLMSAVSVAIKEHSSVKLIPVSISTVDWSRKIMHSQGATSGTIRDIFKGEIERITKYVEKEDLFSVDKVITYLKNNS